MRYSCEMHVRARKTDRHTHPRTRASLSLIMPSDLLSNSSAAGGLARPWGEGSGLESEWLILHSVCLCHPPPPPHPNKQKKKRKKTQRGPWPAVFHPLYMLQATISGLLWKRQRLDSENNSVSDTNQPFLNFTECDTTFWTKTFEGPLHLYFAMSRWNVLVHVTLHFKFSKDFFILKIENI